MNDKNVTRNRETGRVHVFDTACEVLRLAYPKLWAVYVYGSYAQDEQWPGSDLDLAFLLLPGQALAERFDVANRIATRIGRDVDLVDIRQASDVLRFEVLAHGKQLINSRPDQVLAWEASAITRYGHYRKEVGALHEAFNRTGVGYAG